jgi:hypothetical protein
MNKKEDILYHAWADAIHKTAPHDTDGSFYTYSTFLKIARKASETSKYNILDFLKRIVDTQPRNKQWVNSPIRKKLLRTVKLSDTRRSN